MKKLGIMQPYLFPYIGYFQLLAAVDEYVVFDDAQYIKGGWINRNNILIGGQKVMVTFALDHVTDSKNINELSLSDDFKKFLRTIPMAYSRAPYKDPVTELLNRICSFPDRNLARFITNSLIEIAAYLEIPTKITISSELKKDNSLKAQSKVIAICKELHADMYINAIGGQELYSREDFARDNIELKFLKTLPVEYEQLGKPFVPGLSIIDVLMFNSPEKTGELLVAYELI